MLNIEKEIYFMLEDKKVGDIIRIERIKKGYDQETLAKLVNKSKNWMHKIETGQTRITLKTLDDLSNALEIPFQKLLPTTNNEYKDCIICGCYNNINIMSDNIETILSLLKQNHTNSQHYSIF